MGIFKGISSENLIKTRDPDTFNGSDPDKLSAFFTSCTSTFQSKPQTYRKGSAQVNYAISFLRGTALDLFEPYILAAEDSEANEPELFHSWALFKEMLTENFGPPNPIEDAEDALRKLKFDDDTKATQYFTEFAKYKAKTYFNDRGYYHIASQALPLRIHKPLAEVIPAPATFDALK